MSESAPPAAEGAPATDRRRGRPWYRRRAFHAALAAAILGVAFIAFHALSREVTLDSLRSSIAATPRRDIALAFMLTAVSFTALAFYDVIAVHVAAPGRVPAWLAGCAGAAGYAISNTLGFALLTGGTLRARIYGARGLDVSEVGGVMATAWLSFWLAVVLASGLALSLDPAGPAALIGLPSEIDRAAGLALLGSAIAFFAWLGTGARTLRYRSFRMRLPGLRLALGQTTVALIDIAAAAGTLFVLLPAE